VGRDRERETGPGTGLQMVEADKTVKFWKEEETVTLETHPINFRPPPDMKRF
jgi:hypothetical protein